MTTVCYRCGNCGTPTDKDGRVLHIDEITSMDVDWENAELVVGNCCRYELEEQDRRTQITREMSLDAGDPEMEGEWW